MKHINCDQNCRDRDRTPTRSPLPEFQQNFKHSNTLQWVSDHAKLHSSYQQNKHQNNDKTPIISEKQQKSKSVHGPSSPVLKPKLFYSDTNLHKSICAHHDNKFSTIKTPEKHLSAKTAIFQPYCPDTSHSTSFTSDSDKTLESKSLDAVKESSGCQYSKRQYIKSSSSQIVPRRCRDDRDKFNSQLHNGEWFQNEQTVDNPSFCQQTQSFNFEVCNTCSEDSLSHYTDATDILSGCVPLCNETGFVVNVSDIERENRLAYRQRLLDDKCQWYLTNSCRHVNAENQPTPKARNGCGKQNLRTDFMHQIHTCTSLHRKPSDQNVSPEPFSETLNSSVTDSVNFNLNAAQLSNIVPSECFNNSHIPKSHMSEHFTTENIIIKPKLECRSNKRRESDSSCDTFVTCEDGISSKPVSPDPVIELSEQTHKLSSGSTKPVFDEIKVNPIWLPPSTPNLDQSDIFSSDNSFIEKRKSVTVRKKKQCRDVEQMVDLEDRLESFQLDNPATGTQPIAAKPQTNKTSYQEPNRLSIASSVFDTAFYGGNRPSTDSIYSNISVKEYVYQDLDRGITLIERHVPSECGNSTGRLSLDSVTSAKSVDSQKTEEYDWKTYIKPKQDIISVDDSRDEDDNETVQLSKQFSQLSNEELRNKLKTMGDDPGPVIASTRQTYLIRLASISKNPGLVMMSKNGPDYSLELRQAMEGKFDMGGLEELEIKMMDLFNNSNGRRWREGALKSSFNYLLLDPRVTKNLPLRAKNMGDIDIFCTFVAAIFYVGKGKRSRPYTHLYEAISQMNKPKPNVSDKVQQILDIWSSGQGVVSLHIFQNIIPVEAYTREGCIIQTISLDKLTNKKKGDFYGVASTWSLKTKRQMGVYFLKKALQIFLGEGERQICPPDIKTGQ
ncbi:uncharacterized protein LOC126817919 [Patella vulgata]|uniref:uncharacterized protein LOC126817919 n=1 Tax=Patella vulgata TaxID=6465 RepID=UPI0024A9EF54|nr:uncharacterized protein LOC126817919 [Patella vulgata]